jgi:hypothetical protein
LGTFTETAIIGYRLPFADQGKHIKMSVFRFRLQQTIGSLPLPSSVCRKQMEVAMFC